MDNRKNTLFDAATVKRKVTQALTTWSSMVDNYVLPGIESEEDRKRVKENYLRLKMQYQEQINKKVHAVLSAGVINHSSIWLPVCVNYPTQDPTQEYSKQKYLDLMLEIQSIYGFEQKVEMSLFPNRYLPKEGNELYSEEESIAISIQKWNEEEPKTVSIDKNGMVQIQDDKYKKLAGQIINSAQCLPQEYDSIKAKLEELCISNKDLREALDADLKASKKVEDKLSLKGDSETKTRLSRKHIIHETTLVLAKMIKISKSQSELPEFNVRMIVSPHGLFKLMDAAIGNANAHHFGLQSYSIALVEFKRAKNQLTQKPVSQTQESTEASAPKSATKPLAIQKNEKSSSMQGTLFVGERKDAPPLSTTHLGAPSTQRKGRSSLRDSSGDSSEDPSSSASPSPISSSPTSDGIAVVGRKGSGQTEIQMVNEERDESMEKQPLNRRSSNTAPSVSSHALFASIKTEQSTEVKDGVIHRSKSVFVDSQIEPPELLKAKAIGYMLSGGVSGIFRSAIDVLNKNNSTEVSDLAAKVTTAMAAAVINNS